MNSAEEGGWARASTSHLSHTLLFTSVGRHRQCHLLGCQPSPQLHGEPVGAVHVSVVDDHADVRKPVVYVSIMGTWCVRARACVSVHVHVLPHLVLCRPTTPTWWLR